MSLHVYLLFVVCTSQLHSQDLTAIKHSLCQHFNILIKLELRYTAAPELELSVPRVGEEIFSSFGTWIIMLILSEYKLLFSESGKSTIYASAKNGVRDDDSFG